MRRGISLLEVLVASVILAVGLLGAMELVTSSAISTRRVADRERALLFARSKMDEILKEPVLQTGSDRGEGVDTTTEYDWTADIVASQHPSLVSIVVTARNRQTGVEMSITALRRPDLQSTPQTGATGETTPQTPTPPGGPAGGGGLL